MKDEEFDTIDDHALYELLKEGQHLRKKERLVGYAGLILLISLGLAWAVPEYLKEARRDRVKAAIQHPDACQLASSLVDYTPDNVLTLPASVKVHVSSDKQDKNGSSCGLVLDDGYNKYFALITINYDYSRQADKLDTDPQKTTSDTGDGKYYYMASFSKDFYDGYVQVGPMTGSPDKDLSSSLCTVITANEQLSLPTNTGIASAN